jgi:hypothetical protein
MLAALAFSALANAPLGAQQRIPAGWEEGLFDVVAPGLPQTSVAVLVTPRGKFLLPVHGILEPLAVPFRVAADSGVLRVVRPAGVGTASLWWTGGRRLEVTSIAPLDSDDVYVDGTRVFVAANRMAELLEGTIDVDVGTLAIGIRRESGFPAQIKLDARQRRRNDATMAIQDDDEEPAGVPFRARSGAGVMEWAMGGPLNSRNAPATLDLRAGLGLLGGMLQLHGTMLVGSVEGAANANDREVTYRRVFPGRRWLQQIQLGSVLSDGAEARPMRGFTLTNAPFVRGLRFDDVAFSRPLPPGWEYEVYEGARLVGFADESRSAPLSVPLR